MLAVGAGAVVALAVDAGDAGAPAAVAVLAVGDVVVVEGGAVVVVAFAHIRHQTDHRAVADEDRIPHGLTGLVGEGRVVRADMGIPVVPVHAGRVFAGLQHPNLRQGIAFVVLELVEVHQPGRLIEMVRLVAVQLRQLGGGRNAVELRRIAGVLARVLARSLQIQAARGHAAAVCGQDLAGGVDDLQSVAAGGGIPHNVAVILHRERRVGACGHDFNGLGDASDDKRGVAAVLCAFHGKLFPVFPNAGPKHTVCVLDGDGGFAIVRGILFHGLKLFVTVNVFSVIPHGNRPEAVSVHIRVCTVVRAGELALEFFRIRGQIIETVIYLDVRDIAEANRPAAVGEFLPTAVRIKALVEIIFPKLVRKHTRSVHSA